MQDTRKSIAIIIPAYNEEENIPVLYKRLSRMAELMDQFYTFRFLFVDDGSTDNSLVEIARVAEEDSRVLAISLSRNFGKEAAMIAGLDHVDADAVIIMDADLQHPPELIPDLTVCWEDGFHDVYAKRRNRKLDSPAKRVFAGVYYHILQRIVKYRVYPDVGDFRLLDRKCVEALRMMRESGRSLKNIFSWIGYKKCEVPYDAEPRRRGHTKWSFSKLLTLAMDGFTSFTTSPLKISMILGWILIASSIIMPITIGGLYSWRLTNLEIIIAAVMALGGLQLVSLGIMGEYVGRTFVESKRRPLYLIEQVIATEEPEPEPEPEPELKYSRRRRN